MKTMFIINPVSGKGKGQKPDGIIREIDAAYQVAGHEYEIRIWEDPNGLHKLIEDAVAQEFEVVVAAGGDGTINEICKLLVGTDIALGVIPIGSGNGFARHLGYSRKPRVAIGQLLRASTREVDLGDFGGMPFINNAGIGIDAAIAEQFAIDGKRGLKTYLKLASKAFFKYKAFDCKIVVDGTREYHSKRIVVMDIANGPQWGNGAKIAPLSRIDDGFMEAVIIKKFSIFELPRMIRFLFSGKLYRHPAVKYIRGKSFEIYRYAAGHAHVDGESIQLGSSISCRVMEKSIRLLFPENLAMG